MLPPKVNNLLGKRVGKLKVVNFLYTVKGKGAFWECKCDCGNRTTVMANSLVQGGTKSCGCVHSKISKNTIKHATEVRKASTQLKYDRLVGEKFNKLTILSHYKDGMKRMLKCKCDCGNITNVRSDRVIKNITKSCGCLNVGNPEKNVEKAVEARISKRKEQYDKMIGKKFNRLLVVEHYTDNRKTYFVCKCDCGNTKDIAASQVVNGYTKACGCIRNANSRTSTQTSNLVQIELEKEWGHYVNYGDVSLWDNDIIEFKNWALETGFELGKRLVPNDPFKELSFENYKWV